MIANTHLTTTLTPQDRVERYSAAFPKRPPLISSNDWVYGTWLIGSCYKNPNKLYGAYPRGYLERIHSMFPDAQNILHVFSGGLTHSEALKASNRSLNSLELVDLYGPDKGRYPTWQGDLYDMPPEWYSRFDLILADPPYSTLDAHRYEVKMPDRRKVIRHLHKYTAPKGNLVWLDLVWPMHRKDEWKCWAQIGLVRSTNHRVRLVSIFEHIPS